MLTIIVRSRDSKFVFDVDLHRARTRLHSNFVVECIHICEKKSNTGRFLPLFRTPLSDTMIKVEHSALQKLIAMVHSRQAVHMCHSMGLSGLGFGACVLGLDVCDLGVGAMFSRFRNVF